MSLTASATDADLLSQAVATLAQRTHMPIAFGGYELNESIHVSSVVGHRTPNIPGLVIRPGRGLGGRAMIERRPRLTIDYGSSRQITHDYDAAILGEGICTLFSVPLIVGGRTRGLLYCGTPMQTPIGDNVARSAMSVAHELSTELRVREEVQRRIAQLLPAADECGPSMAPATREQLRESYAELRSIAADVEDDAIRDRLATLQTRLATLSREDADPFEPLDVRLSPREIDVLACAALGSTNGQIAATLQLREGTVKSYLQAAMSKLGASTRHAAVARARRAGLLP